MKRKNMSDGETHNCEDEQRLEKEIDRKEIRKLKYFLDELMQLRDYAEMEIGNR